MIKDLRETRIANLVKANQIKEAGYETSVHALPEKVRVRLDRYLDCKFPSMVCLRKLCSEFPSVYLPSYKAVQNYRKKYHVFGSKFQQTLSDAQNKQTNNFKRLYQR